MKNLEEFTVIKQEEFEGFVKSIKKLSEHYKKCDNPLNQKMDEFEKAEISDAIEKVKPYIYSSTIYEMVHKISDRYQLK